MVRSNFNGFQRFSGPQNGKIWRVWPGGIPRKVVFRVFPGPGRPETCLGSLGARRGALPGAFVAGSILGGFSKISTREIGLVHPKNTTLERFPGFSPDPTATESTSRHRAATPERCAARPVVGSRHHSNRLEIASPMDFSPRISIKLSLPSQWIFDMFSGWY